LEHRGYIRRLERGVYQLTNATIETHHSLAEVATIANSSVVCLVSALTVHGLTDQLPRHVWIAIGYGDRKPKVTSVPLRVVRMSERLLHRHVEVHAIEKVSVKVFSVAKTVADCFRMMRIVGSNTAIEGLREALRQRKATPAALAEEAKAGRVWSVMRPYLEALTSSA
jgi:predicted transcriptional regulator of viral defense system